MRLHECCRGTSKCLQSCWGLEKLVLVSWECHAVAWHYGLYEIWRQACQWFGFALRLCSWSRMLAPGNSMEADLHTPRFPYVLIIYSLPVLLFATLCSSSFSGHIFLHFLHRGWSTPYLLHIFSILAEACGRLLELLRQPFQFVGSDMAVYICVNIGIGEEGSSLNPLQASESIVILETNVSTSSVPTWH